MPVEIWKTSWDYISCMGVLLLSDQI